MAASNLSTWTYPTSARKAASGVSAADSSATPGTQNHANNAASNKSPRMGQGGNTLHASMNSLSLGSRSPRQEQQQFDEATSPRFSTRPDLTTRVSSSGLPLQPQSPLAAIGSGRLGTSPPSNNSTQPASISTASRPSMHGHTASQQHTTPWPSISSATASHAHRNSVGSASYKTPFLNGAIDEGVAMTEPYERKRSSSNVHIGSGLVGEITSSESLGLRGLDNTDRLLAPSDVPFASDTDQLSAIREQRELDDVDSGQRASATLWMGDLEAWMDETYIRRCIAALGWDRDQSGAQSILTSVKMIKGASTSSGYCFITFPAAHQAQSVLAQFAKQPPMLMPGSERTFKLNWATGLPGVQPKWEGEYSVFVGDIGRETTEGELVALFTPIFPSTKSAKIMYDQATGYSRGYGFVRFGEEADMHRSLALGQNTAGGGLSLRGRTLRISEASGPGGTGMRQRALSRENGTASPSHNLTSSIEDQGQGSVPDGNERTAFTRPDFAGSAAFASRESASGSAPFGLTGPGLGQSRSPGLLSPNASAFNVPISSPLSASSSGILSPMNMSQSRASPALRSSSSHPGSYPTSPLSPSSDPNNTTVFVGGLPASISEDTLRTFFQHFGEITYVKVPPNKGCGFVQFVRRSDAELAIAKMHDFPIHGKSRIRLSWGRSQGDKQVEHVRKLANALHVPFESVWRMVQGQDNSTLKQIASAVGNNGNSASALAGGYRSATAGEIDAVRMDMARLGLSLGPGAAVVGSGQPQHTGPYDAMSIAAGVGAAPVSTSLPYQPMLSATSAQGYGWPRDIQSTSAGGPYSRVSPSAFAPINPATLGHHMLSGAPLSPPSTAGLYQQHQSVAAQMGGPYTPYSPMHLGGSSPSGPNFAFNGQGSVLPSSNSHEGRTWQQPTSISREDQHSPNPDVSDFLSRSD